MTRTTIHSQITVTQRANRLRLHMPQASSAKSGATRSPIGWRIARSAHPAAIGPRKAFPPGIGHFRRVVEPLHQLRAQRELREPGIEVVEPRVVGFLHAARWPAHGAESRPLALRARRAEAHDPDRHE